MIRSNYVEKIVHSFLCLTKRTHLLPKIRQIRLSLFSMAGKSVRVTAENVGYQSALDVFEMHLEQRLSIKKTKSSEMFCHFLSRRLKKDTSMQILSLDVCQKLKAKCSLFLKSSLYEIHLTIKETF